MKEPREHLPKPLKGPDFEDVPMLEDPPKPKPKKYRREVAPMCVCGKFRVRRDPFGVPLDQCELCMYREHVEEIQT